MADQEDDIMTLLIDHLAAQSTITALVGTRPVRIFPGDVPLKVDGVDIKPPWINIERGAWDEEKCFSGGTGTFRCPSNVVVIAPTITRAAQIFKAVRDVLDSKWSVAWSTRLFIGESSLSVGTQVPLLEADGSPSQWQQIIGELFLLCSVSPAS